MTPTQEAFLCLIAVLPSVWIVVAEWRGLERALDTLIEMPDERYIYVHSTIEEERGQNNPAAAGTVHPLPGIELRPAGGSIADAGRCDVIRMRPRRNWQPSRSLRDMPRETTPDGRAVSLFHRAPAV